MNKKPDIYWEFQSDGCSKLRISGSLGGMSLTFHLENEYDLYMGAVALTSDRIIADIRRLEAVLIETVALNERRKEKP